MNTPIRNWAHSKTALKNFEDLLRCYKCSKVVVDALTYSCGHFYCRHCVSFTETTCQVCNLPSQSNEIIPDNVVNTMVDGFHKLASVMFSERNDLPMNATDGHERKDSDLSQITSVPNTLAEGQELSNAVSKIITHNVEFELQKSLDSNALNKAESNVSVENKSVRKSARGRPERKSNVLADQKHPVKRTSAGRPSVKDPLESFQESGLRATTASDAGSSNLKDILSVAKQVKEKPSTRSIRSKKSKDLVDNPSQVDDNSSKLIKPKASKNLESEGSTVVEDEPSNSKRTSKRSHRSAPLDSSISHQKPQQRSSFPKSKMPSARRSSNSGKSVERNQKGETPLHAACTKGKVDVVRKLLDAKANPNTKDNAGWTPLHEAALQGNIEIAKLLLGAHALINVPGEDNLTPLHEAVKSKNIPIITLLVSYGADVNAPSSDGRTPLDLAETEDMKNALLTTKVLFQPSITSCIESQTNALLAEERMVLGAASGLTDEEKTELNELALQLEVKVCQTFGPEVTHLVVPSDSQGTCPPSMELLSAILRGIWILTRDWLKVNDGKNINEIFELSGVTDFQDACAPKRSRVNTQSQLPRLFNGCHFYIHPNASSKLGGCSLTKAQLSSLIKCGEGVVLSRSPNPESIPPNERTIPYHSRKSKSLASTSHYIIFSPGKGEPIMKYNMQHCKTLTVEWLMNCILNWKLIDP